MKKIILTKQEAQSELIKGVNKIADCVASTLGPSGKNVIIDRPYQNPLITNDGVTVAKEIVLDSEIQELGAKVIKEATKRTNDEAGDGTTTTTVILRELVNSVFNKKNLNPLIATSENVMDIKRKIDADCKQAVELLKSTANEVKTLKDIENIASVSMENKEVGKIIASIFHELGKDADVNVEIGSGFSVESEIKDGVNFPFGFISPYMANIGEKNETVSPLVLATNIKINQAPQIQEIIKQIRANSQKDIVIFAEHFDKEIVVSAIQLKMAGVLNIILVKVPAGKPEYFEDVCAITGATLVDESKGDTLESVTMQSLGKIDKVVITKDKTILIGRNKAIDTLTDKLEKELEKSTSEYDKNNLSKRIAKLKGKVGVITVGAKTESEKEYLKLKIDDAVNATKCAMQEGYVKGGGIALKEVAEQMKDSILYSALMSPYNVIRENAGGDVEVPDTVIDPVKVTRTALENACSIAGVFITTDVAIADKFEEPKDTKI